MKDGTLDKWCILATKGVVFVGFNAVNVEEKHSKTLYIVIVILSCAIIALLIYFVGIPWYNNATIAQYETGYEAGYEAAKDEAVLMAETAYTDGYDVGKTDGINESYSDGLDRYWEGYQYARDYFYDTGYMDGYHEGRDDAIDYFRPDLDVFARIPIQGEISEHRDYP